MSLRCPQQLRWFGAQRASNPTQDENAWIPYPALNSAHIGQVNFSRERQLFLSKLSLLAEPPHILPNNGAPIVHLMMDGGRAYIL